MAPDSDVLGGPEPEEQGAGVFGRSDAAGDEDELGGADLAEDDELGGADPGEDEDELGGADPGGDEDELGGADPGR
jgi:hypothetical protein